MTSVHTQWVALQDRKLELREPESLAINLPVLCSRERETLFLSSKVIHHTKSSERVTQNKGSQYLYL